MIIINIHSNDVKSIIEDYIKKEYENTIKEAVSKKDCYLEEPDIWLVSLEYEDRQVHIDDLKIIVNIG